MTQNLQQGFAAIVGDLEGILDALLRGAQVPDEELRFLAGRVYNYIITHAQVPLSDQQALALNLLSSAPSHPALQSWKDMAIGASHMYARLTLPMQRIGGDKGEAPDSSAADGLRQEAREAAIRSQLPETSGGDLVSATEGTMSSMQELEPDERSDVFREMPTDF